MPTLPLVAPHPHTPAKEALMPSNNGLALHRQQQGLNNVSEMLEQVRAAKGTAVRLVGPGQTVRARLGFELDGEQTVAVFEMWLYGLERWQTLQESTLRTVLERHGPYTAEVERE
jgi:hypothetical protein